MIQTTQTDSGFRLKTKYLTISPHNGLRNADLSDVEIPIHIAELLESTLSISPKVFQEFGDQALFWVSLLHMERAHCVRIVRLREALRKDVQRYALRIPDGGLHSFIESYREHLDQYSETISLEILKPDDKDIQRSLCVLGLQHLCPRPKPSFLIRMFDGFRKKTMTYLT